MYLSVTIRLYGTKLYKYLPEITMIKNFGEIMKIQSKSKRKYTGAAYHRLRKKKKYELGSDFHSIKLAPAEARVLRTLGGDKKVRLLQADRAVLFPGGEIAKIITVKENPANPHFVRMNIITKGAIIQTELGLARVVSRPGQDGIVNAKLIEQK